MGLQLSITFVFLLLGQALAIYTRLYIYRNKGSFGNLFCFKAIAFHTSLVLLDQLITLSGLLSVEKKALVTSFLFV